MIKYIKNRVTPPKRILAATGSLIPSNNDEIIEMSSTATANIRIDYSIGVLFSGVVKEFKNNSTQFYLRLNFNSQITLDGVLNPGVISVPPGAVYKIITTENTTVTNDYTSLGFSSFRILQVIYVANTTDVVDSAFLNIAYPIENYTLGTIVSYYNMGVEWRRITSTIWTSSVTNIANTVFSGTTLTFGISGWYAFSGTTSTGNLPVLASSIGRTYYIKNRGTGNVTISANGGTNDIYNTSAVTNIVIAAGSSIILHNDGTFWTVN